MTPPSAYHEQVFITPSRTDYIFVSEAVAAEVEALAGEERVRLLTSWALKMLAFYEAKTTRTLTKQGEQAAPTHVHTRLGICQALSDSARVQKRCGRGRCQSLKPSKVGFK